MYNDVENHLLQAASHVIESLLIRQLLLISCDLKHVKTKSLKVQ